MLDKIIRFIIILSWVMFVAWGLGCLSGCSHTKKAFAELSKKVDSVFVSRSDTSYRNKRDSSNTVLDFHGADIIIPIDPMDNSIGYFEPNIEPGTASRLAKIFGSKGFTAVKKNGYLQIHIDSGTLTHGNITTVNSGKGSKVDSISKHSEEKQKTKTVDRKGNNALSTILIYGGIVALLIFLVLKFKSKIPFIKNI